MRRPVLARALLLPLFMAVAFCSSLHAQQSGLRAINLLADSGPLDLFVADTMQPRAVNLPYGAASQIIGLSPGPTMVIGNPSGLRDQRLLNTSVDVAPGTLYDLMLVGTSANVDPTPLEFIPPAAVSPDSIYLRIVNASTSLATADYVFVAPGGGPMVLTGNAFKSATSFMLMPRGSVRLKVTAPNGGATYADMSANIAGGTYATIFISGPLNNLRVQILSEGNPGPQLPMTAMTPTPVVSTGTTRVRLVNLVTGSSSATLGDSVTSTTIVGGVPYRGASASVTTEAGLRTFTISAGSLVAHGTRYFSPDREYIVYVYGTEQAPGIALDSVTGPGMISQDSAFVQIFYGLTGTDHPHVRITDRVFNPHGFLPSAGAWSEWFRVPAGGVVVTVVGAGAGGKDYQGFTNVPGGAYQEIVLSGAFGSEGFGGNVLRIRDTSQQPALPALTPIGSGYLRVINVAPPKSDSVSIYSDTAGSSGAYRLSYLSAGPMSRSLPAMGLTLKVAHNYAPVTASELDVPLTIKADTLTSVALIGGTGGALYRAIFLNAALADVPTTPGRMAIRFINAAPDAGSLDLNVKFSDGSSTTVTSLGYGEYTAIMPEPAGNVTVRIARAGTAGDLALLEGPLGANKLINAFIVGNVADNTLGVRLQDETAMDGEIPLPALAAPAAVPMTSAAPVASLDVMPNPASNLARLLVPATLGEIRSVDIVDGFGRRVHHMEGGVAAGAGGTITLPVSGLASGAYIVELRGADRAVVAAARLVVTH